jgi:hypothetical protein
MAEVTRAAVVIGAVSEDSPWLPALLDSLDGCRWPVVVNYTRDWELATIAWAARKYDEFIFLPESTVVLDQAYIDRCFTAEAGHAVNLGTAQGMKFRMYLGKYVAENVQMVGVPPVASKMQAIEQEVHWCVRYAKFEERRGLTSLGGPLEHTDVREWKHGRENMVVENEWLRKWKGTWW